MKFGSRGGEAPEHATQRGSEDPFERALAGSGEMAALIRATDWAATPLGPLAGWPASLKTTVATMLRSRHPMFLWWGPELIQIYNDAYVPSFGVGKHPGAMGQRGRECWPEIWDIIGPQIAAVMRDGTPSWHEDALVPIFRNGAIQDVYWTYGYSPVFDDDWTIGGTLVVCTETTGRVVAIERERMLREAIDHERSRLQQIFAQAPAGMCILRGPSLVFEFANDQYSSLVGHRGLIGRPLLSALPELAGQGLDALLLRVMESGEPFVGREMRVRIDRRGNGQIEDRFHTFIHSPLREATGDVNAVIVMVQDVTDEVLAKRHTERLAQERVVLLENEQRARRTAEIASRAKDDFLATASHELRTPLNAILGWARMLQTGQLDPSAYARGIDSIERNARAQVRLVEDILDGSRIITGQLHLEVRPLDLRQLVASALDAVRPAAEAKRIALTVAVDPAAARVTGDPERLQQVVWNLVVNAIKFTDKGGAVDVQLRRSGTDIQLKVSDTGQGIDAEFLPHVFERFRQAEGSTTRRHGGLGLGLALVRHLVEAHGGTVHAESEGPGRGAVFTVTLPVQAVFREVADSVVSNRPLDPALAPLSTRLDGVTVLVVDDEEDARDLVATALRARGAEVRTAKGAAEALEAIATTAFMVLVSDIGMAGSDGYELISRLRGTTGAHGLHLPALALTAYSREEDRRRALDAGFDGYTAKPVDPDALVQVVADLVNGRGSTGHQE